MIFALTTHMGFMFLRMSLMIGQINIEDIAGPKIGSSSKINKVFWQLCSRIPLNILQRLMKLGYSSLILLKSGIFFTSEMQSTKNLLSFLSSLLVRLLVLQSL